MKGYDKKIYKNPIGLLIFILLFIMAVPVKGSSSTTEEIRIEQARIYMPDIKLYCYLPDSLETENITVTLNNEKLIVKKEYPYTEDEQGCDYYLLLDISKSISGEYFQNIKNAVQELLNNLNPSDTITIITFGDQVTVAIERAQKGQDIATVLNSIENNNDNTHLFEALEKMSELADDAKSWQRRVAAIAITDGEDCSTNESTRNKALENLLQKGIPLYSMVVKETASGNANAFIEDISDFTRESQGSIFLFGKEEAKSCIEQIQSMLQSAYVFEVKASSNRLTSVMQPLTLSVSGGESTSIQVCPRYSQADNDPPKVKLKRDGKKNILIIYDEPVLNAGEASNYKVTLNGELLPIYAISYDSKTNTACLAFSENLKSGKYVIEFQNISDNSMNENILQESAEFTISPENKETKTEEKQKTFLEKWGIYIGIGGIVVLSAAVGIVFLLKRKKKETAPSHKEEVLSLQDTLYFDIRGEQITEKKTVNIQDKIIVGRSGNCDVSLLDALLSRQHFSIEKENANFYITNLSQTNGTKVNGIEISSRCKLKNGDVIQAGSLYITIGW